MFDAHKTIERLGYEHAWRNADSKFERVCLTAAMALRTPSSPAEVTVHASLAVTCLPHRRPVRSGEETRSWTRTIGDSIYHLESGLYDDGAPLGIPFGSKARLILLYLHEHASRGRSPVIDVVPSMHAWVHSMGIRIGGMTYRQVGDQARRIAGCTLGIGAVEPSDTPVCSGRFVNELLQQKGGALVPVPFTARTVDTANAFPDKIVLSDTFYRVATAEPLLLRAPALRQIVDNSWAIDLYIWLAYQLPRLEAPLHVAWELLFTRFGVGYKYPRQMKAGFVKALQLVLAIYPGAQVEIDDTGFILFPTPPPVAASQHSK